MAALYEAWFGLQREPFSIAPDPRLLYLSTQHREALAHLLYGLQGGGGFVLLTGEIGTGKTTLSRSLIDQIESECQLAYVLNPRQSAREMLLSLCREFGLQPIEREGTAHLVDALHDHLLQLHAQGRKGVLVVDEAQELSVDVLEQLRLLTNLETDERKLLQIILIGQPELRALLEAPRLAPLVQRVIARCHLGPLSREEAAAYISHRLAAAGLARPLPFDAAALRRIHARSGGVPRRINLLCDRSLLGAYATGQAMVDARIVDQADRELRGQPRAQAVFRTLGALGVLRGRGLLRPLAWVLAMAAGAAAAWMLLSGRLPGLWQGG